MSPEEQNKKESLFRNFISGKIDRRTFIVAAASLGAGYALSEFLPDLFQSIDKSRVLTSGKKRILKEVLRHLFPATQNAPGADDINALIYLQVVLLDPQLDPRDQNFIINGIQWLEEECQKLFALSFPELKTEQKEQLLREIEKEGWGERWLSYLLKYIFESLLTDPLYGGKPDGVGWKWLGHVPGYPRPNQENRYGNSQ